MAKKNKIQKQDNSHLNSELEEDKIVQLTEGLSDNMDNTESIDNQNNEHSDVLIVEEKNTDSVAEEKDIKNVIVESHENCSKDDSIKNVKKSHNKYNMKSDNEAQKITMRVIISMIMKNWWIFLLNCLIIGAIAALLIIEEPRTYTTEIKLAPETETPAAGGGLSSIASSFGIDLGDITSSDAIRPDIYPDLVQSNDFVYALFKLPVKTLDGNIYTDYYTYLKKYQKSSWWGKKIYDLKKKLQDEPEQTVVPGKVGGYFNDNKQRILTRDEENMIGTINGLISCSVDQKTFVITISVTDQDPLVAATVADSVRQRIQNFITDYRTKKAIKDYNYYYALLKQAKSEYEQACQQYANYVDTHRDVILQAYISERDQLENNMQIKLNTYNAMIAQVQNAKAKVQEKTPAFTILQNAFVPVKPTGPKRMLFVLGMVFLTFFVTLFFILGKILSKNLKS